MGVAREVEEMREEEAERPSGEGEEMASLPRCGFVFFFRGALRVHGLRLLFS